MPGFVFVQVSKGTVEKAFFTLVEYDMWRKQQGNLAGWKIKYYKVRASQSISLLTQVTGQIRRKGAATRESVVWLFVLNKLRVWELPRTGNSKTTSRLSINTESNSGGQASALEQDACAFPHSCANSYHCSIS